MYISKVSSIQYKSGDVKLKLNPYFWSEEVRIELKKKNCHSNIQWLRNFKSWPLVVVVVVVGKWNEFSQKIDNEHLHIIIFVIYTCVATRKLIDSFMSISSHLYCQIHDISAIAGSGLLKVTEKKGVSIWNTNRYHLKKTGANTGRNIANISTKLKK